MGKSNESDAAGESGKRFVAMDAVARIEKENGRWVVYLNIQSWEPNEEGHPVVNNWKRINDYSSEQDASVAASWYERSANRTDRPPLGF